MEIKILNSIMLALQELVWPQPNQHMVERLMVELLMVEPLMVESILVEYLLVESFMVEHFLVEPSWWSTS